MDTTKSRDNEIQIKYVIFQQQCITHSLVLKDNTMYCKMNQGNYVIYSLCFDYSICFDFSRFYLGRFLFGEEMKIGYMAHVLEIFPQNINDFLPLEKKRKKNHTVFKMYIVYFCFKSTINGK